MKQVNKRLSILMAIGMVIAVITGTAGFAGHQEVGIALGAGMIAHHALHYRWIVAMSRASLQKLPPRVRRNLILNIVALLFFLLTIVSGFMNEPIRPGTTHAGFHWHVLHLASAWLTFLSVVLHLVLHRGVMRGAAKRGNALRST